MNDTEKSSTELRPGKSTWRREPRNTASETWLFRWPSDQRDWIFRGLIVLATGAFLSFFPKFLFVVYMGKHGYFDYAFFEDGPFPLTVFYGTAELLMVLASLLMFGLVIPVWARLRHGRWDLIQLTFFGILNTIFLAAVLALMLRSKGASLVDFFVFIALGLLIAIHIAVLIHENARRAFGSLIGLFMMAGAMVAISPTSMASLLGLGLRVYGVGGGIPVALCMHGQAEREGKLIFLGPLHMLVQLDGESMPRIVQRAGELEIRYLDLPPKTSLIGRKMERDG